MPGANVQKHLSIFEIRQDGFARWNLWSCGLDGPCSQTGNSRAFPRNLGGTIRRADLDPRPLLPRSPVVWTALGAFTGATGEI